MTNTAARTELERLLAILGPRWVGEADPEVAVRDGVVEVVIPADRGPLLRRMAWIDRAATVLASLAVPIQCKHGPADWGTYASVGGHRLNGVEFDVWTPILAAEMDPQEAIA